MGELENLSHIQGSLIIHGLKNVMVELIAAKYMQLKKMIHLRVLCLNFDTIDEKMERRRMHNDVLVLDGLEPPPHLESLRIELYMGTRLSPNWMTSLTTLKKLTLSACLKLEWLPPLGKLLLLESLVIASTKNV